jgi:arylsulfatase
MGTGNFTRRSFLQTSAAAAVEAAAPPRPNILLLFPDQFRFDWVQWTTGLEVRTPNLAALAARGTMFTRAIVPSPLCAPSRACFAAGKEYQYCRVAGNDHDYPLEQLTHYTMMRQAGYHVAVCGKVDLHKKTMDWGLDGKRCLPAWGFSDGIDNAGKFDAVNSGAEIPKDPYMAYLHNRRLAASHVADFDRRRKEGYAGTFPTPLPDEAYCDNWIGQNGLRLLSEAPKDRPWYLSVNFTGPHNPEDITTAMETGVRKRSFPQPNGSKAYTPEVHVAIRQNYTAMVENLDRWVGIFLDELRRRSELDRTVVVFSSDHGEMLGDHDRWGKSVPWQPSVSVPLIMAGPKIQRDRRVTLPVTTLDLPATFLEYSGLSTNPDMQSHSLRALVEGKASRHREVVTSALGSWRMAFDGRYKLIQGFDPQARLSGEGKPLDPPGSEKPAPLLFDLEADPLENHNILTKATGPARRLMEVLN